jgi:hypothetical protein
LKFDLFISPPALILFYYLGALGIPVLAAGVAWRLGSRFPELSRSLQQQGRRVFLQLPLRYRLWLILLFGLAFLFMELMWRMLFEYLVAFMQMRDALVGNTA